MYVLSKNDLFYVAVCLEQLFTNSVFVA